MQLARTHDVLWTPMLDGTKCFMARVRLCSSEMYNGQTDLLLFFRAVRHRFQRDQVQFKSTTAMNM